MGKHLEHEIKKVKEKILNLSKVVESNLHKAIQSVSNLDMQLAEKVIESDKEIDIEEIEVEEECLKILALHQPVAIDLRIVISILKINNDLERIGDIASNIAYSAKSITKAPAVVPPFDFKFMSEKVSLMLKGSLDSFIQLDIKLAKKVRMDDNEIDTINHAVHTNVYEKIKKNPEDFKAILHYLMISKSLERIADYATNIAEDVTYIIEGSIIRHRGSLK